MERIIYLHLLKLKTNNKMGFLDSITAKITEKANQELTKILPEGETVLKIYIVKEDFCALTEKRVVFVDKKLVSSKKTLTSVPYSKINFVALKRGGFLSISKEVIIGTGGLALEIDTYDGEQAYEIVKEISKKI